jgi:hypothetical protein
MTSPRLSDAANEAVKSEIDALRDEVKRLADLVSEMAKAGSEHATRTLQGAVERDLAAGRACVIQIVSTGEVLIGLLTRSGR